jgi:isoleucyl-tRNA synthetase
MNKCLKDFVVRSRGMMGFDVPYTPGWDCHGLPIEHKVMTELVEGGKIEKLKTLDEWTRRGAIRRECQKHAEKYIKLQAGQMQRLLTVADYEDPYMTMAPAFEGATLEVLATLLERGLVSRALKPVHWSIANETALAEAELEYYDREDLSVYVDFEAADAEKVYDAFDLPPHSDADDEGEDESNAEQPEDEAKEASVLPKPGVRPDQRPCFMIWTTTPWTLPANLGITVNPKFEYALVWIDGNVTILAADAIARVTKAAKSEQIVELARTTGSRLLGLRYRHPFVDLARKEGVGALNASDGLEIPANAKVFCVLGADYVTLEDGTGLVHTAPGHGQEDYMTGLRENVPVYCPVRADGTYDNTVPAWLRGKNVWEANKMVAEHLRQSGHLFYDHTFTHSYPHDWRSKTPTIFRCTEQWFVGVDRPFSVAGEPAQHLRQRGLESTRDGGVTFVPEWGRNRLRGMLESRPDWCISRQRAWGLPIPAFETTDGHTFMTAASVRAVVAVVRQKGSDAWFSMTPADLLAKYDPATDPDLPQNLKEKFHGSAPFAHLKKGGDILDVWFESGSSWNSVMRERGQGYPCDLYLEGSDQHRGWFQLSLLPALGVTGVPPFKTLLTHGFMVDRDGRKLSKSRSDAARYEVDNLCTEFGMDVMRWWVSSLAYENDVKVDVELFGLAGESYRKVRNTLRFMLSNLSDFTPTCDGKAGDCVDLKKLAPTSIDAWILGEYDRLAGEVIRAYEAYDFKAANKAIFDFCNTTLSAEYLAAVKDRLYCDAPASARRRTTQTVLWELTDGICRLLAPIMAHTADEAYRALWKATDPDRCVHTQEFIRSFGVTTSGQWAKVMQLRETAKFALEQAKSQMGVDNPLDAGLVLPNPDGVLNGFDLVDLADLLGVSEVEVDAAASEPKVLDLRARPRCERSWKRDKTVRVRSDGGTLSDRDALAVGVS